MDDFKDHCGEGVHPLLTELQSVLAEPSSVLDSRPTDNIPPTSNASPQNSNSEIIEETTHGTIEDHSVNADLSSTLKESDDYKVVCYCKFHLFRKKNDYYEKKPSSFLLFIVTNWAWYRQGGGGKFLPEDIDHRLCTHIVYG